MKRRNMLKKAGLGSALSVVALPTKAAAVSTGGDEYVGVVYDPVTGEIQGEASMSRASLSKGLRGELTMRNPQFSSSDLELTLDQEIPTKSVVSGPHRKPRADYKIVERNRGIQSGYTSDDEELPLIARIITIPGQSVGGIVRPLGSTRKSAFYLSKKRPSVARGDVRKRMKDKIPKLKTLEG